MAFRQQFNLEPRRRSFFDLYVKLVIYNWLRARGFIWREGEAFDCGLFIESFKPRWWWHHWPLWVTFVTLQQPIEVGGRQVRAIFIGKDVWLEFIEAYGK